MAEYRREDTASWDREQVRRAAETERHSNTQQPKKRRRKKKKNYFLRTIVYILFVLITSAILAGVGWLLASDLCAFNKEPVNATIEVTADDTMNTIADKLEEAGLIEYKWFFRLFGSFADAEEKIGIGVYELKSDMDYRALIVNMHNSSGNMNAETVTVTIPEGYTVQQIIALLAENGVNTTEALTEAAQKTNFDYSYINNNSEDISRLEGFLFPDTYEFYKPEKAANALDRLISNFDDKLTEERLAQVESSGHSLQEIITIASLIEKETDGSDHAKIASVIYNRLANAGETAHLLQIDAALLYALPEHTGPITNEVKEVDSPYNLYKNKGLPPTAIANPGIKSIEAALNPADTNFYFYALGKDGQHKFSETLAEHNNFLNSGNYGG